MQFRLEGADSDAIICRVDRKPLEMRAGNGTGYLALLSGAGFWSREPDTAVYAPSMVPLRGGPVRLLARLPGR